MIISSEHHELLEQFKAAEEIEVAATMELHAYILSPNPDKNIATQLAQKFEKAHEEKMLAWKRLKKVSIDQ
ncbi:MULTISPECIES: hypothetical protein [Geobacter]|uniref:hypothetical protein n=1 Tax=Geobacter sulfurreducens TaxID=35554 RepID=UPI0020B8366C|nr:hypothetical protein [Geobacter sulfurreducens]UTG91826.1 hypothetical protein J8622_12415 [Geobacter sulfurreducens]